MSAGILHLTVDQGATYNQRLTWKVNSNPVNLDGYSARMKARLIKTSTPVLSLTSTLGGGLTLGEAAGTIDIYISAQQTASIPANKYHYDLEIVAPNGDVTRLVKGTLTVTPEFTY
jgi:hypothetical protein